MWSWFIFMRKWDYPLLMWLDDDILSFFFAAYEHHVLVTKMFQHSKRVHKYKMLYHCCLNLNNKTVFIFPGEGGKRSGPESGPGGHVSAPCRLQTDQLHRITVTHTHESNSSCLFLHLQSGLQKVVSLLSMVFLTYFFCLLWWQVSGNTVCLNLNLFTMYCEWVVNSYH